MDTIVDFVLRNDSIIYEALFVSSILIMLMVQKPVQVKKYTIKKNIINNTQKYIISRFETIVNTLSGH